MTRAALRLRVAVGTYGHTAALRSMPVPARGVHLEFVQVEPIIGAFRRMVRDVEFDVCELAPTTYLIARAAGVPITALPVFLLRRFHAGDVLCRAGSGIDIPQDLEHRRVGVRAYSVTTGVWVRGLLARRYGVDHRKVTWVVDDEEHVRSLRLPSNVERLPAGGSIAERFAGGDLDAALGGAAGVGRVGAPGAGWERAPSRAAGHYPLFPAAAEEDRAAYRSTGMYPLHGVVCVKQDVIDRAPEVGPALVAAFTSAKQCFLDRLASAASGGDREARRYAALRTVVGPDPLPYGLAANEATLRALVDFAVDQQLLTAPVDPVDLFAPGTT